MRVLHVPEYIHSATDENGCLTLLNERTGQWHVLNQTAARAWRMARGEESDTALASAIAVQFPGAPLESIQSDVEALLTALAQRGLIQIEDRMPAANTWCEIPMALESAPRKAQDARHLAAATAALPIAVALSRLPFPWAVRFLRASKRRLNFPQAAAEEADAIAAAVQRVARGYPGRVACYEHSLTIVVSAMLLHRTVDLLLGAATDPRRFHAWVETSGHVVAVAPHSCPEDQYQPVLRL